MGDIATLRWFFENGCDVDHQVGDEEGLLRQDKRIHILLILLIPPSRRLPHTGQ